MTAKITHRPKKKPGPDNGEHRPPGYLPTPEEIKTHCAKIRESWTEMDYRRRSVETLYVVHDKPESHYTVPTEVKAGVPEPHAEDLLEAGGLF